MQFQGQCKVIKMCVSFSQKGKFKSCPKITQKKSPDFRTLKDITKVLDNEIVSRYRIHRNICPILLWHVKTLTK